MQHKASFSWRNFNAVPIIGIVRGMDFKTVMEIAQTYTKAGFSTLEVTMNTKDVQTIIGKLRTQFPDLNVGAGTVCTLKDFKLAKLAGAQFIVTPIMQEEVIKRSVEEEIPIFPGAYTPTEIYKAWSLGASAIKIFPATQLGPQFIKDMLSPLDSVNLLPTGGVSKENIRSYFEA
ncbi:MAG: bifunctional 4-hydroxy-2-oxoglutarate aldolase/2-dehydro-3-deoxy-phosphogluconate aldolase, partial [Pricia sp.]|nr:bifunctional 4-hydroxy-2-oxoglutarate aldolase/2-dehydro-3-deoxy-phosphogluconate aldolase [Pricia sp.]